MSSIRSLRNASSVLATPNANGSTREASAPSLQDAEHTQSEGDAHVKSVARARSQPQELPTSGYQELFEASASDDEGNPCGYQAIQACIAPLTTREP